MQSATDQQPATVMIGTKPITTNRANRVRALVMLLPLVVGSTGCSTCCNPYDHHYGAFGGIRERLDRMRGRVGSVIAPADAGPMLADDVYMDDGSAHIVGSPVEGEAYSAEGEVIDGAIIDESDSAIAPEPGTEY